MAQPSLIQTPLPQGYAPHSKQAETFRVQAATVHELAKCEARFWYFLAYIFTLDPKAQDAADRVRRFPRYPYLRDAADTVQSGRNVHIVKSRQMIATTLLCAFSLWSLLFRDGWSGLLTSRKDTLVDDGGSKASWNSLFGRVLFMYRSLPPWMRLSLEVSANKIVCPFRQSYIIGESGNVPAVGRGGTFSTALMDEAAKIPKSETAFSSINDAARQVIMNSTPAGKQGVFYRIYRQQDSTFVKMRLHWKLHPERDDAWYQEQCRNRTPEDIAEELDCSFEKSVQGRCIPEFDWDRNVSENVRYQPHLPLSAGCDFGIADPTAFVFFQHSGDQIWIPSSIQRDGLMVKDFAGIADAVVRRMGYEGDTRSIHCDGDAEGDRRSPQTGITTIRAYREHGWHISPVRCHERERVRRWRLGCKSGQVQIHPDNGTLIECLQQLHYPRDSEGRVLNSDRSDPKAHEYSHLPDAGGYHLFRTMKVGESVQPATIRGL